MPSLATDQGALSSHMHTQRHTHTRGWRCVTLGCACATVVLRPETLETLRSRGVPVPPQLMADFFAGGMGAGSSGEALAAHCAAEEHDPDVRDVTDEETAGSRRRRRNAWQPSAFMTSGCWQSFVMRRKTRRETRRTHGSRGVIHALLEKLVEEDLVGPHRWASGTQRNNERWGGFSLQDRRVR